MVVVRSVLYLGIELYSLLFYAALAMAVRIYYTMTVFQWLGIPYNVIKQTLFTLRSVYRYLTWWSGRTDKKIDLSNFSFEDTGNGYVRGPCPYLNTLANHGYINRAGKHITIEELLIACKRTINLSPIMTIGLSLFNMVFVGHNHPLTGQLCLSLSDLSKYHAHITVEHDASFTRRDLHLGDAVNLDQKLLTKLLAVSKDGLRVKEKDLSLYRKHIQDTCERRNPMFTFSMVQKFGAWMETAFIILFFGNGRNVSVDSLRSWIGKEKIPDNYKPRKEIGILDVFAKRLKLMYLGNDLNISIRNIFDLVAPLRYDKYKYVEPTNA
jgi:hypothetical protein